MAMKKELKKTLTLTTIITLLPIFVGLFYWNQLPDKMATHFDMTGTPNGWSSKWFAVIGIPVVLAVVNVLCTILTETDPRRHKYPEKMMKLVYWICPVVSWICAGLTISYELGIEFAAMPKFGSLFMGIMFVVIGNYLPKVKQNYYMGIKLPWTCADEENWNRTHRMAGKLWVVGGIILLLNFFLDIPSLAIVVLIIMMLVPTIYSWAFSRKKDKEKME
jgi:uncharacterized membrane protein